MSHKALVIEHDPSAVEQIEEVLAALSHEYDLAASLLQARKLLAANEYSYVLLDIEFPTRYAGGPPRIQNAENFLDGLAGRDDDAPPVVIMSEHTAGSLDETENLMRLAMLLGRKGAIDLIKKPFPSGGRTLDRVVKKVLGEYVPASPRQGRQRREKRPAKVVPAAKRGRENTPGMARSKSLQDDSGPSDGTTALTKTQRDVLEALAESPHETMHLAEVVEASGYRKHATREALTRLRSLGLAHRPQGERRGDALTAKGRALLDELKRKG